MSELLIGIIVCILLYFMGQRLYPDNTIQQRVQYSRGMAKTIEYSKESAALNDWQSAAFGDDE